MLFLIYRLLEVAGNNNTVICELGLRILLSTAYTIFGFIYKKNVDDSGFNRFYSSK